MVTTLTFIYLAMATTLTLAAPAEDKAKCPVRCVACVDGVAECSKRSLVTPPKDFPLSTGKIILDNNHLRVLGTNSFQRLEQVEVLRLKGNRLRVVKRSAFKNLPRLMTLDLSNNDLVRVYTKGFDGLNNLQTLALQYNKLRTLAKITDYTPKLFQLNVAFNNLREIGKDDLKIPTRIHYLDLRNNRISKIHPQAFQHLTLLRYLFLNKNPLVTLPELKFSSEVLQLVDFSNCRLTHVPRTMPHSVSEFRLNDNNIMEINDTDFANMTNLKLLALNNNELHFVGNTAFRHLVSLDEMWLRNNRLVYIPRNLPDNLQKLYMDANKIREIEDGLFTNQSKLHYMTVEMNRIGHIGNRTFAGLRYLKTLNLRGNRLRVIAAGTFASLGNLTTLSFSDNPLETIEDGAFQDLANLTDLNLVMCGGEVMTLGRDLFQHMPALRQMNLMSSPGMAKAFLDLVHTSAFTPLHSLSSLDLTYNDLDTLPSNLREVLPNLETLSLDGNPWVCDKRLIWLHDWMTSPKVKVAFNKYEPVVCEKPLALKGREVGEVKVTEFGEVQLAPQALYSQEDYDRMVAAMKSRAANAEKDGKEKEKDGKDAKKQDGNDAKPATDDNETALELQNDAAAVVPETPQPTTPTTSLVPPTTQRLRRHRKGKGRKKGGKKDKKKRRDRKGKGKKGKGRKKRRNNKKNEATTSSTDTKNDGEKSAETNNETPNADPNAEPRSG